MSHALSRLQHTQLDIVDAPDGTFGERSSHGERGRPLVTIYPEDLAALSAGRTTRQEIADLYGCSARTIRRRLLAFGISPPGPPVYVDEVLDDGSTSRQYFAGRNSNLSQLSDAELDSLILTIHNQFPSFRRRMVDGYLLVLGERVPRRRVEESFERVLGPSDSRFGPRCIERRVYSVPGPNSLWHHDGQHGR